MAHRAHCGHTGAGALNSHATGVAAHVAIYLAPGVDAFEAWRDFEGVTIPPNKLPAGVADTLTVEKIHISLGEIDMIADLHAAWTNPQGHETELIGKWVSEIRQRRIGGVVAVARTSTAVCMSPD